MTPANYDFREVELNAIAEFSNGKSSPKRDESFRYPVYGSNGIIGQSQEYNSDEETIIIGRVGSYCGSLYFSDTKCWVTDNAIISKARKDTDPKFLYYLLGVLNLNDQRGGSGQPLLNQGILNAIRTEIPPFEVQKGIGSILYSIDCKIFLNQTTNATLEKFGQALFKHWFIDFEFPNEKGKPYKSSGGKMVDSELGEIPKGWDVGKIGEML